MTNCEQFLDNVAAFLEYKKEEGFQTLEISEETKALLKPLKLQQAPVAAALKPQPAAAAHRPVPAATVEPTPMPGDDIRVTGKTLEEIAKQISTCEGCELHASRNKTVPGEGNGNSPDVMFIGEAPGPDEDAQGKPFVGKPGQLLTKMIGAMGYTRDQVFLTNIVKCRPPGTRVPVSDELNTCHAYLRKQIELIKPKIIIAMGKNAVEGLLNKPVALTRLRGTWCKHEGIDVMPTFHPSYLEQVPSKKREAWDDLQAVMAKLGKK